MYYIGLMSGTSIDGIDAALLRFPPPGGIALTATHTHAYPPEVRTQIESLLRSGDNEVERFGHLDHRLGELFAEAVNAVLHQAGVRAAEVVAIGSHGQTVRHCPAGTNPFSLQAGSPAVIAERTGITTVADFRAADIAAGGQGAPLVPAFHQALFQAAGHGRVILNIGGIANITWLPPDVAQPVLGFDTGPGNTLLDNWIARQCGEPYDRDGRWAATGRPVPELLEQLLDDPYFARPAPKSTGREYFHLEWLDRHLRAFARPTAPADVQATLVGLTAGGIARAVQSLHGMEEVFVCGGGAHNRTLMARLAHDLGGIKLETTAAIGLHPDWVEAAAFAWLAYRTLQGQTGNLPSVTGARHAAILGGIYPAPGRAQAGITASR